MKESCCQFGPDQRLAGIITEPGDRAPNQGLLLVSAGLLSKSGPYRLYTLLARRLAQQGVVSLRFDLGGLGDSLQEASERSLRERSDLEVQTALDHLAHGYGPRELLVGGLCSGAEDAFRAAARDPRVTGVVLIDPFAYRTRGWALRHFLHRIGRRSLRALGAYAPLVSPRSQGQRRRVVSYKYLERAESEPTLRALLERGVRLHFVYTAGMREHFNHPGQLHAQFPDLDFRNQVTVDYLPHVDHTQLLEVDRHAVIEAICRRLQARA